MKCDPCQAQSDQSPPPLHLVQELLLPNTYSVSGELAKGTYNKYYVEIIIHTWIFKRIRSVLESQLFDDFLSFVNLLSSCYSDEVCKLLLILAQNTNLLNIPPSVEFGNLQQMEEI